MRRAPGAKQLIVKDEGRLPTGSFKARGLALAVAMAKAFGLKRLAMPTNGNAGAALAAYAARAGIESACLLPRGHAGNQRARDRARRCARHARRRAHQRLRQARRGRPRGAWAGSTSRRSRSPIASRARRRWASSSPEQLGWTLPDVIFYPTGGGTGTHRHVEGLRRSSRPSASSGRAAADGRRAGDGLRADRAARGRKAPSTRRCGRTRKPTLRASACRQRSATS